MVLLDPASFELIYCGTKNCSINWKASPSIVFLTLMVHKSSITNWNIPYSILESIVHKCEGPSSWFHYSLEFTQVHCHANYMDEVELEKHWPQPGPKLGSLHEINSRMKPGPIFFSQKLFIPGSAKQKALAKSAAGSKRTFIVRSKTEAQ